MGDITHLLKRWRDGDPRALDELTPLVYGELRQLAAHYMRHERTSHTLQPTALVHEAYLRLIDVRQADFRNSAHFFGAAARAMRRILVDHARRHRAAKRGQGQVAVSLDQIANDLTPVAIDLRVDLVSLDDALRDLAAIAERPAQVVELRYFGGLTVDETAAALGIAPATVKRHWSFARAWLHRALDAA